VREFAIKYGSITWVGPAPHGSARNRKPGEYPVRRFLPVQSWRAWTPKCDPPRNFSTKERRCDVVLRTEIRYLPAEIGEWRLFRLSMAMAPAPMARTSATTPSRHAPKRWTDQKLRASATRIRPWGPVPCVRAPPGKKPATKALLSPYSAKPLLRRDDSPPPLPLFCRFQPAGFRPSHPAPEGW